MEKDPVRGQFSILQGIHWPGKKYNAAASHIWKCGCEAIGSYSHSSDLSKVQYFCHLNVITWVKF